MARVPPTMRAALLRSFGGPDVLRVVRDAPRRGAARTTCSFAWPRRPSIPWTRASAPATAPRCFAPPPLVLGRDVSGEVVARGANARAFPLGASVFGALSP